MNRWVRRYVAVVGFVAAGVLAAAGGLAHAQPGGASDDRSAATASAAFAGASPGLAVARAALVDLRLQREVAVHDYEIAQQLLGLAQSLAPDEVEIVRHRIEAATGAGRDGLVDRLTRELVALDPGDTVAQLRLITAQLDSRQTARERLDVYERLLGPRGDQLDAALRSRLALDAALLARELGDDDGLARSLPFPRLHFFKAGHTPNRNTAAPRAIGIVNAFSTGDFSACGKIWSRNQIK